MKFFIPHAESAEQAERVLDAVIKFNHAPPQKQRIAALAWQHKGMKMSCEVGGEAPTYYQTSAEPVVAILDCGALYKVCTTNRGVVRGEAIFVGKSGATATYFDA
jgi:hypothetical protein